MSTALLVSTRLRALTGHDSRRHTTIITLGLLFEVESDVFGRLESIWQQYVVWWIIGLFYLWLAKRP